MRLIDHWRERFFQLWSIRAALFFMLLNGLMVGVACLSDVLNPWLLFAINVIGWPILIGARLLKQPGASTDG